MGWSVYGLSIGGEYVFTVCDRIVGRCVVVEAAVFQEVLFIISFILYDATCTRRRGRFGMSDALCSCFRCYRRGIDGLGILRVTSALCRVSRRENSLQVRTITLTLGLSCCCFRKGGMSDVVRCAGVIGSFTRGAGRLGCCCFI